MLRGGAGGSGTDSYKAGKGLGSIPPPSIFNSLESMFCGIVLDSKEFFMNNARFVRSRRIFTFSCPKCLYEQDQDELYLKQGVIMCCQGCGETLLFELPKVQCQKGCASPKQTKRSVSSL